MTRLSFAALVLAARLTAFEQTPQVQEPPEEDLSTAEKQEYSFNPLQASKEIKIGNFYFKKGSYKAAARRFEEALKWDANAFDAYLRLGEAQSKLGDTKAAKDAFAKFLELQPESKQASEVKKKLAQLR